MRRIVSCLLFAIFFQSCDVSVDQTDSTGYFELTQLMDKQVSKLAGNRWRSEKVITINSKTDRIRQNLDSVTLKEELAIFKVFDPGKPRYKNAFETTSTGSVTQYTKKATEDQSLQWVKVDDQGDLLRVTAEIIEETSIYTNQKEMELLLESGKVRSYALRGYQKMLFRDTAFFEMKTNILN